MNSTTKSFEQIYFPRFLYGQVFGYIIIFVGVYFRAFFDQIGVWQGFFSTGVIVVWCALFLSMVLVNRDHNYSRNNEKSKVIGSLYSWYVVVAIFFIFIPIGSFMQMQKEFTYDSRSIKYLSHSDQLAKKDWHIDYYHIDQVYLKPGKLHWWWTKDQNSKSRQIKRVAVTAFRQIERIDSSLIHYFYSKTYEFKASNISKHKVNPWVKKLSKQAKQELSMIQSVRQQCMKRVRSSEFQTKHMQSLKKSGIHIKAKHMLLLSKAHHRDCQATSFTLSTFMRYFYLMGGVFLILLLLFKKMVHSQKKMTQRITEYQKKKREKEQEQTQFRL